MTYQVANKSLFASGTLGLFPITQDYTNVNGIASETIRYQNREVLLRCVHSNYIQSCVYQIEATKLESPNRRVQSSENARNI